MRFVVGILAASAAVAVAQHNHGHAHHHAHHHQVVKREAAAPHPDAPVVEVYELNGGLISKEECDRGIANGTLVWDEDSQAVEKPEPKEPAYTPPPPPPPKPKEEPKPEPKPKKEEPKPEPKAPEHEGGQSSYNPLSGGDDGLDREYDGSLSCDTFPSEFGAMPVPFLGLCGWTGIQNPKNRGEGGYDDIETITKDQCQNKNCCKEGQYCSYACKPGYQKTQWPGKQGATGQSVGGLKCEGGKLKLTRGDVTKKLCEKGTDKVSIKVTNRMGKGAAVCRTDYPGTESETVPSWAEAGGSIDLACPEGENYYRDMNDNPTSAQYYVNNAGVGLEEACQWGSPDKPTGNYSPLNIGAGYSAGAAWLSIFQNWPSQKTEYLDFAVHIEGDDIVGKCRYKGGKYCSGDNYDNCNDREGCTVTVKSGEARFVFS